MADELTGGPLHIHQKLHGYAQGHQELASSIRLPVRDERALLVLSDASGPGLRPTENGYLTGYPLAETKYYALAKTWPAPEVSRPGCVWTHTLLIDFADLALLTNPQALLSLFKRPSGANFQSYMGEILFAPAGTPETNSLDAVFLERLIRALYRDSQVTAQINPPDAVDIDASVIEIWAQQWPRLRRSFRFCTFAIGNRPAAGSNFDLQVAPPGKAPPRIAETNISTNDSEDAAWIGEAVEDLLSPNVHGLRTFLRQVGAEVEFGREAFPLLCSIHSMSGGRSEAFYFSRALEAFKTPFDRGEAHALRRSLVNLALRQPKMLEQIELNFVLENLALADDDAIVSDNGSFAKLVLQQDPQRFVEMLSADGAAKKLSRSTLEHLQREEVAKIVSTAPQVLNDVLALRHDFLEEPSFWSANSATTRSLDLAISTLSEMPAYQGPVIEAIIAARRTDLARLAAQHFEPAVILDAISRAARSGAMPYTLDPWIEHLAKNHIAKISRFLSDDSQNIPVGLLESIARHSAPDSISNDAGADPWLTAVGAATPAQISLYLHAFLLSRALGRRSQNAAELAQLSYEPLYLAASRSAITSDAWRILEPRLPMPYLWMFWDRCDALRSAITSLFTEQRLSAARFADIAKNDEVFEATARTAARYSRGRKFLKEVQDALETNKSPQSSRRVRLLDDIIH